MLLNLLLSEKYNNEFWVEMNFQYNRIYNL